MRDVLLQQVRNEEDIGMVLSMLSSCKDYDADSQKPIPGKYVLRPDKDGPWLRRLEDIDESWVRKYLTNTVIGIKINRAGGLREYKEQHRGTRVLVNSEGDTIEEGELLLEQNEYSSVEIAEAKAKLPYLLKRLFDKSLEMRVSVMSLVINYEKAREVVKDVPKPRHILGPGVFRMQADGHLGTVFPSDTANSSKSFRDAYAWLMGRTQDAYFRDMMELLRVCAVLGIDLSQEDPHDYQVEDINKMRVTYIAKNRDYLRGSRKRNLSALDSLSTIRVSDFNEVIPPLVPMSVKMANIAQAVLDCDNSNIQRILAQKPDSRSMNRFFTSYAKLAGDFRVTRQQRVESIPSHKRIQVTDSNAKLIPILDDFLTRDGFLYSPGCDTMPQLFRVGAFFDDGSGWRTDWTAIAHAAGYLFILTEQNRIYYQDAIILGNYIEDCLRGEKGNKYIGNHTYGWWECCFA